MRNQKLKDRSKRVIFKKHELKHFLFKGSSFLLKKHPTNIEKINLNRAVNRCVLTNRNRSVFRLFKISRHMFRFLGSSSFLPGVKKISW